MKDDLWFRFIHAGKDILVPTTEPSAQRERENILIYGSKYGIQEICVVDGENVYKLTSNEVVSGSDVMRGVLDCE